ncbi:MAG TPA: asparagine synthase (glutamine-hydrolyzing) [Tepidisphaeraceae bacterium]|nr:asparagine synthase (glutamine-hydrolyzing) [Tepidisphaeraceae bacterium]
MISWNAPVEQGAIRRAIAALRHRGPDGQGIWQTPDGRVALGHARLSIIDLETGAQPIANEDGKIVAVVNGEFYEFEAIRRDLEKRGHHFSSQSDSEILLHLYEDFGEACLEHLRGEFAFVLWDGRRRKLFAARDRFGIKPLCYANAGGTLWIASEAKALFAAGLRPAWNHAAAVAAMSLQYVLPEQTLFAGVKQVPPGHYLLAHDGKVDLRRYWDMDFPRDDENATSAWDEDELRGELFHSLDDAVAVRLRADVPVCFHLSGGLDSSTIAGLSRKRFQTPMHCFTVAFEHAVYDELAAARETGGDLGAVLHEVRVTQADLLEALPTALYYSEGLAINGHLPAKFLLSRAIHQAGFKVVLSGEGADELFAGYPHLREDLLRSNDSAGGDLSGSLARLYAANPIMAGIQLAAGDSLPLGAIEQSLGFIPSFLRAKGTLGYRMRKILSDDFTADFSRRDCCQNLLDAFDITGQLRGRNRVDQATHLWSKLALANYILRTLGDGTEMAHSVEGRLPFLDHRLFEFARRLPLSLKIKGTTEKYLLRQAAKPVISDAVYHRQKQPFTAPPLARFTDAKIETMIHDRVESPAFAAVPFLDRPKMRQLLDRIPMMPPGEQVASDPVLMMALSAAGLQEQFKMEAGT